MEQELLPRAALDDALPAALLALRDLRGDRADGAAVAADARPRDRSRARSGRGPGEALALRPRHRRDGDAALQLRHLPHQAALLPPVRPLRLLAPRPPRAPAEGAP